MDLIISAYLPCPPPTHNRIESDHSVLNGPYLMSATLYSVSIRQWSGAHSCGVQYGFAGGLQDPCLS